MRSYENADSRQTNAASLRISSRIARKEQEWGVIDKPRGSLSLSHGSKDQVFPEDDEPASYKPSIPAATVRDAKLVDTATASVSTYPTKPASSFMVLIKRPASISRPFRPQDRQKSRTSANSSSNCVESQRRSRELKQQIGSRSTGTDHLIAGETAFVIGREARSRSVGQPRDVYEEAEKGTRKRVDRNGKRNRRGMVDDDWNDEEENNVVDDDDDDEAKSASKHWTPLHQRMKEAYVNDMRWIHAHEIGRGSTGVDGYKSLLTDRPQPDQARRRWRNEWHQEPYYHQRHIQYA